MLYVLNILISIALMVYGYFAVFKSVRLVSFYRRCVGQRFSEQFEINTQKWWFYINLKVGGVLVTLFGLAILIHTVYVVLIG